MPEVTTTEDRQQAARSRWITAALLGALVVLMAVPLWLDAQRASDEDERFGGTDAKVTEMIEEDEGYEPWFEPIFAPSGGEIESGLFAAQAALGAGVGGYAIAALRGRRRLEAEVEAEVARRLATIGAGPNPAAVPAVEDERQD